MEHDQRTREREIKQVELKLRTTGRIEEKKSTTKLPGFKKSLEAKDGTIDSLRYLEISREKMDSRVFRPHWKPKSMAVQSNRPLQWQPVALEDELPLQAASFYSFFFNFLGSTNFRSWW